MLGTNDMKDHHYYHDCLRGTGFSSPRVCDTQHSDVEIAEHWEEQMQVAFREVVNVTEQCCGVNTNLLLMQPAKLVLFHNHAGIWME